MRREGWRFYVDYKVWMDGHDLRIAHQSSDGTRRFVKLVFEPAPEAGMVNDAEPTLTESRTDLEDNVGDVTDFMQSAMDAAWTMGLRPAGYADHASQLTATKFHLEDMRALVFKSGKP